MKLSTKGRYGLRAIVDMAVYCDQAPVSISEISARQDISVRYLEQLLGKLRKAGLINSIRGSQGGYVLARKPESISVGDVLRALEGDLNPVNCAAITDSDETCSGERYCVTKSVWKKINDSITQAVDSIDLKELADESRQVCQGHPTERRCEHRKES